MHNNEVFNIAFLPQGEAAEKITQASQKLKDELGSHYYLSEESLPHISIIQFSAEASYAETLLNKITKYSFPQIKVNFTGLALNRWRGLDGMWLRVNHHPEIRKIQEDLLVLLDPIELVNGRENSFEPHSTLAAWPSQEKTPPFTLPEEIMDLKAIPGRFALGTSGPLYQFKKIVKYLD